MYVFPSWTIGGILGIRHLPYIVTGGIWGSNYIIIGPKAKIGAMAFVLSIASDKPERLRACLAAYARAAAGLAPWSVLVCDGSDTPAANQQAVESAARDSGICVRHLTGRHFDLASRIVSESLGREAPALFSETPGGARNLCLAHALASGATGIVFCGDGTAPAGGFFGRYEARFGEGWKLVPGGLEGHARGSAPALLMAMKDALAEADAGITSPESAASSVSRALRGAPPRRSSHSRNAFSLDNVGVSRELAGTVPFPVTALPCEAAMYRLAAEGLAVGGRGTFLPANDASAYRFTPIAESNAEPGDAPVLFGRLRGELKGCALMRVLSSIGVESLRRQTALSEDEFGSSLAEANGAAWSDFNMDANRTALRAAVPLSSGEERDELERIISLEEKDAALAAPEAKSELALFSFSIRAWPYVTAALENGEVKRKLLEM